MPAGSAGLSIENMLIAVFDGIAANRIHLPGYYPEWSGTSYSLLRILIIALTLVIVFPYLPGSSSPAFQGVSIFLGVLFSLGSTSAVANVVGGIVITYTRAFKIGDRVKISNTEGDVIERSTWHCRRLSEQSPAQGLRDSRYYYAGL